MLPVVTLHAVICPFQLVRAGVGVQALSRLLSLAQQAAPPQTELHVVLARCDLKSFSKFERAFQC